MAAHTRKGCARAMSARTAQRKDTIMIGIRPGADVREGYVRNITRAYAAATTDQRARGKAWYQTAHELAGMMADGHPVKGAGVIAALSANKSWSGNKRLAADALTGNVHGTFADALRKAAAIIAGADPATVLPMALKTGHFYRCIADPADPDAVVIDRHAHDVAAGEVYGSANRGLSNPGRYAMLAHCYREAGLRLGELASTIQAVTWVAHTERTRSS